MITPSANIALIGFGEVGSILGEELTHRGCAVRVWDILLADPAAASHMKNRIEFARADASTSLGDALRGAKLVICAVTVTSATDAAHRSAGYLSNGQIYVDLNGVSVDLKRAHAALIEASGAHYIDALMLESIASQRLATPMLLAGLHAAELSPAMNSLGFSTREVSTNEAVAFNSAIASSSREHIHLPALRPVPRAELP